MVGGITGIRPQRAVVWRRPRGGRVKHALTVDPQTGGVSEAAVCGLRPRRGFYSETGYRGVCGACSGLIEAENRAPWP